MFSGVEGGAVRVTGAKGFAPSHDYKVKLNVTGFRQRMFVHFFVFFYIGKISMKSFCLNSNSNANQHRQQHHHILFSVFLRSSLQVCATYMDGFRATAVCPVGGPRAAEKARRTADSIIKRCVREETSCM